MQMRMAYKTRECGVDIPEDPDDIDDFVDEDIPLRAPAAREVTDSDIDRDSLEGSLIFRRDKESALAERGIDDDCDDDF